MSFPDLLIRGIPSRESIDDDGLPSAGLFNFNKGESKRVLGYSEESINWHDDDKVVNHSFNQKKDNGSFHFKIGLAILARSELDRIRNNPNVKQFFSYDRHALADNPYHGNLLMHGSAPKPLMRKIASDIALNVKQVILRDDHEEHKLATPLVPAPAQSQYEWALRKAEDKYELKEGLPKDKKKRQETPPPKKENRRARRRQKTGVPKQTNNKRMAVPGSKQPFTQMPAWARRRPNYRCIKFPK